MHPNAKKRQQLLAVLYQAREAQAGKIKESWTTEADLNNAVGDIDFGLSVLIEIGHVKRDGYLLRITAAGVLACEAEQSA